MARQFWRPLARRLLGRVPSSVHYARIGLDQDPLELALHRGRTIPLPEVAGFSDERVKLLSGICREMQRLVGNNSFFLPTRKLGRLLGAHWSTVARWLVALETLNVIRLAPGEVRKRGGNRSPRYHYGPPTQNALETTASNLGALARPLLTGPPHVPDSLHSKCSALTLTPTNKQKNEL